MRKGCSRVIEIGGLHDGGLINQAFGTVFRNHFLYLQLSRVCNYNLLADILDESVSLFSRTEIWTISRTRETALHHLYGNPCALHIAILVWSFVYLRSGCPEPQFR